MRAAHRDDRVRGDEPAEPVGRAESDHPREPRRAVAGFDFTFSVPKSASVLWGVADAATQEIIVTAHHDAVAQV
ncbi:relaxase domain-containing protein, partial [Agromyces humi]|uniref:relaxase domain-containing protein n=1 Tax=Agromyces humi TaxID=1766800 RepID=UPI00193A1F3E